jgi:type IV secretion system protein VirB5
MAFFKRSKKTKSAASPNRGKKGANLPENVSWALDEKTKQEIAESNPWMKSKKRHVDVYQELAFSVAQWRLSTFAMMLLLGLSVFCNFTLAKGVKVQPYVVEVDQHGYAVPVKGFDPANVDHRIVSAQIGTFIVNSRARFSDVATQLIFSENSYKSVAANSSAAKKLDDYYISSPPTGAKNAVGVRILSISPLTNATYQASWVETIYVAPRGSTNGRNEDFGFIGTFTVVVSPPSEFDDLMDNPLGVYVTDFNIIRSR